MKGVIRVDVKDQMTGAEHQPLIPLVVMNVVWFDVCVHNCKNTPNMHFSSIQLFANVFIWALEGFRFQQPARTDGSGQLWADYLGPQSAAAIKKGRNITPASRTSHIFQYARLIRAGVWGSEVESKKDCKTGCKMSGLELKACGFFSSSFFLYLEHVCIAVMSVLHHHGLGSGQSVRDAVLVFVAYGLMRQKDDRDGEQKN